MENQMKFPIKTVMLFAAALFICSAAPAAEKGTSEEAIAMVKKAAAFIQANGKEKALAEFSNPNGQFRSGDLYITAFDFKGTQIAHGSNPKLIGKNLIDLKDADGKAFVKEIVDTGRNKGSGWVDYKWINPSTKGIDHKSTYVQKVDDMIIGCGIYKN
jgi:cytochrome c